MTARSATVDRPSGTGTAGLDPASPDGPRSHAFVPIAGLCLGYCLVALRTLSLPLPSDMLWYFGYASDFPDLELGHQQLRLGLILPVRAAIALLGPGEVAYHAFPLLAGLVLLLATYLLGVRVAGRWVGAFSACAVMLFPPLTAYLSDPLPDLPATALLTAAVVLLLAARDCGPGARRDLLLLAAGALLGWSYLARETMVLMAPLVAVVLWPTRTRWRDLLVVAAPVVVLMGAEAVVNLVLHGDPLARLRVATGHAQGVLDEGVAASFQDMPRLTYVLRFPSIVLGLPAGPLWLGLMGLGVLGGLTRDRWLRLLLAWSLSLWVPLTLLGGVLDPSSPSLRLQLDRYWFPLLPAAIVAGTVVAARLGRWAHGRLRRHRRRGWVADPRLRTVAAGLALLVLVGIAVPRYVAAADDNGRAAADSFRGWLRGAGADVDVVWTDTRSRWILRLFARDAWGRPVWDGRVAAFEDADDVDPDRPGEALAFFSVDSNHCPRCRWAAEEVFPDLTRPGGGWRLVHRSPDSSVVVYE